MIKKYVKKPIVIEAVPWTGNNFAEINEFMKKFTRVIGLTLEIPTLEGNMKASLGDYIIKGVNGEFYPCKPDIFAKTYEEATVV